MVLAGLFWYIGAMRKESPLQYIAKHEETSGGERLEFAMRRLSQPIGVIEYGDRGKITL